MDTNIEFSTNHSNTPTLSLRYSNIITNLVIPPSPSLFLDGNEVMLACLAGMGLGKMTASTSRTRAMDFTNHVQASNLVPCQK